MRLCDATGSSIMQSPKTAHQFSIKHHLVLTVSGGSNLENKYNQILTSFPTCNYIVSNKFPSPPPNSGAQRLIARLTHVYYNCKLVTPKRGSFEQRSWLFTGQALMAWHNCSLFPRGILFSFMKIIITRRRCPSDRIINRLASINEKGRKVKLSAINRFIIMLKPNIKCLDRFFFASFFSLLGYARYLTWTWVSKSSFRWLYVATKTGSRSLNSESIDSLIGRRPSVKINEAQCQMRETCEIRKWVNLINEFEYNCSTTSLSIGEKKTSSWVASTT